MTSPPLEALKKAAEGLFAADEAAIPGCPAPSGWRPAARRGHSGRAEGPAGASGLTIYLLPVVQGQQAPAEIVVAIERLNAHGGSDGHRRAGRGSRDLAAFNSEA